jgi:hypothetical protein
MRRGWRGPLYEGEMPSLGLDIAEWAAEYLPSPRNHAEELILTDEQARLLIAWYTIDPTTGRFLYRRGISRRSKGWGKSPLLAVIAVAELCGDVRFDGWDARGEPVGRPWGTAGDPQAWVQIAAVAEDQTDNTHSVIYDLLTANEERAARELRLDVGITRTYLRDGARRGKLEPVTSKAGTREGQPTTFGVMDETHLWLVRNGGVALARTVRRNAGKIGGRSFETSNAFEPGEESVAERSHKAAAGGAPGIFYDQVEADDIDIDEATDDELEEALRKPYGDAWWVDLRRLVQEARDPDVPREDVERFSFNWNRKGGGKVVDPVRWDELVDVGRLVADGERIGLGFDGAISRDCVALIGCTTDGHRFVPTVGDEPTIWVRPVNAGRDWRHNRTAIEAAVAAVFDRYDVGRLYCDPPRWQTEIERWAELYGDDVVLFFDTNQPKRMAVACDRFDVDLGKAGQAERRLTHDGTTLLRSHVLAMVRRKAYVKAEDETDGRTRYVFDKGPDGRHIDAGIACVLAGEAAATMPAKPAPLPEPQIW